MQAWALRSMFQQSPPAHDGANAADGSRPRQPQQLGGAPPAPAADAKLRSGATGLACIQEEDGTDQEEGDGAAPGLVSSSEGANENVRPAQQQQEAAEPSKHTSCAGEDAQDAFLLRFNTVRAPLIGRQAMTACLLLQAAFESPNNRSP